MLGFVEPPSDYYMRPYMLAAHALMPVKNKNGLPICAGPQSAADMIFNYARDFAETQHNLNKYFGLFWLNSFSHNDVNAPAALDLRLLELLKDLERIGTYNSTAVILLSDHGIRFGNIRNAFQGFLEGRLPFIFFHFPPGFLDDNPAIRRNLIINKNRLTSPYDVHLTLQDLLDNDVENAPGCLKCQSLFKEVNDNRTCNDAGIDPHWCTCPAFTPENASNPLVIRVGEYLFHKILNRTKSLILEEKAPSTLCEKRRLIGVVRAHRSRPIDESVHLDKEIQVFVVVVVTEPFALFEASVQAEITKNGTNYEVLGFISRLDSYFPYTKCVQSKMLQFYCHCASNT